MDALAAALSRGAGLPAGALSGVYLPSEQEGLARIAQPDTALVLVPLPFLAKHAASLKLVPRLKVVMQDGESSGESWSLVAAKGRAASPAALAGFTISSSAGYAAGFVRGLLSGWGRLPDDVQIVQSTQVVSALRKAASGAKVAVLLDGAQSRALTTLPFAGDLEVVARSTPVPTAVIATVGDRLSVARWRVLERAFLGLSATAGGTDALAGMRTKQFTPLDGPALEAVQRAVRWGD
jgi:hypothetical protein